MNSTKISFIFLLLVISIQLNAINKTRDLNKENLIENQLSAIAPSMVDIFKTGTQAMDNNNFSLADSLYSIVYQKTPTFDPLIRRLGTIRVQLGRYQEGINLCEKAVSINRSAYNLISLASCYYFYSSSNQNKATEYLHNALILLKEAERLPNGDEIDFPSLAGQIALQLNNQVEFRFAVQDLMNRYPDDMVSHYYAAILAFYDKDWTKAKDEIMIAQNLGLPEDSVKKFLDSGVQSKITMWHYAAIFLWIVGIWIVGIFLLFIIGKLLSNFIMSSLDKQYRISDMGSFEKTLRSIYRWLINVGSVYYYISLPIILVLVIALVAVLFYVFLLVGRIPIQLMLVITIGSGFTIYGMVKSLLVKINYTDPGRELKETEAPGLFKLANEVAKKIGTRPIDEIRITPLTEVAVYERGTWREKLQDKGKRVLILGIGVLQDFRQNDFQAVLAHEYGHFSHRDTAGGEVALRVRNDMIKYFYALYSAGQNVWWNIAFQFLRLYNLIFIRISHGATRLQEVLADRVAAQTYSVKAFQNGLSYVIKRNIEFTKYASSEIEEAKRIDRPFNNLYGLTGNLEKDIEDEFKKTVSRKTSEYDTHPSPLDRFRYLEGIIAPNYPDNTTNIKDLFLNWDSITAEMTTIIEKGARKV